ncbi:MAG: PilZ domain-containing protein [Candidatus Electrothrix sp. AR5]|nr:PilZ domain-containing protein [Candidatus Electrothrix sp. AR5]
MDDINKRQFSRIKIRWAVSLDFGSAQYHCLLDNVSLGGFFVKGQFKHSRGDVCKIHLKESALYSEFAFHAVGSIVRACDCGIALEFIGMKLDSYFFLQINLLAKAIDPSVQGNEIVKKNIFDFDDGLLICNTFNCNRNKLKKLLDLLPQSSALITSPSLPLRVLYPAKNRLFRNIDRTVAYPNECTKETLDNCNTGKKFFQAFRAPRSRSSLFTDSGA